MKLSDHTDHIRQTIHRAVENRLGRLGIVPDGTFSALTLNPVQKKEYDRFSEILVSLTEETGTPEKGYEKLADELTFTLFNRLAALKVMEAHTLIPEVVTQRPENGNRSFAHAAFLENDPSKRNEEQEGLVDLLAFEFGRQAAEVPLFALDHYYHMLPTAIETKEIIDAFNAVEKDPQVEADIWQSDDVLGWLYESYNNYKKAARKKSGEKTEYDKVSVQSQVYTPKWVVKFLVDNSLGKQYLEMFPHSELRSKYKIANAPSERTREPKPLTEIRLIDPAPGSGNFLLYAFDLFYDMYHDQIDNYGADYDERKIPQLIIENNLFGVDLDNRAAQIAQLGLYIKAKRKKRNAKISHYNVVSSDFLLPEYEQVKYIFNPTGKLNAELEEIVLNLWDSLRDAHKFGTLIRIEEIFEAQLQKLENRHSRDLFSFETLATYMKFRGSFIGDLKKAVSDHTLSAGHSFMNAQAENAVVYLEILTQKYDVAVANPPYTDSADFGPELKTFVDTHYKKPYKFNTNLYATFIKRCYELTTEDGNIAMVHPPTFMYIKTFEDVRKFILSKTSIDLFVEWGYLGMFHPSARVDSAMYILEKKKTDKPAQFIKLNDIYEGHRLAKFVEIYEGITSGSSDPQNDRVYFLDQQKLKIIDSWPFIYWISDGFREKFKAKTINDVLNPRQGIATGSNERFVRFWWEIDINTLSQSEDDSGRWVNYAKGGPYKKWFGNNWAVIDWLEDGYQIRNLKDEKGKIRSRVQGRTFYFQHGCTYSASGSKGVSFRYHQPNSLFDVGGSCVFMGKYENPFYTLALLNSNLTFYIAKCFNPTVNTQVGDIKRLPFLLPDKKIENDVEMLVKQNINIAKYQNSRIIYEQNFTNSALADDKSLAIRYSLLKYFTNLFKDETLIIFNEYILNELIFTEYKLSDKDRKDVENSFGRLLGSLPVFAVAKDFFIEETDLTDIQKEYLENVVVVDKMPDFDLQEFRTIYNSNNNLEELCKRLQINPINLYYLFANSEILPESKSKDLVLEFLTDAIRTLMAEDDDGIIPLYAQSLESRLFDRICSHLYEQGFTSAQVAELDQFLGKPTEKYIEENFFTDLANHLNLFMYLPKTPFIWHLSSGPYKGFEAFVSIYKWNRDSLFKLKSVYLAKRREQLQHRQIDLQNADTAQTQAEKERIVYQLHELDTYETKIDELIAENYDPVLDNGVAKNIAPLQKKGMLKADVLNAKELEKYLKADW